MNKIVKQIKSKDHIPKGIYFTVSNLCKVFYKEKCIRWEWLGLSMIRFDLWFEILVKTSWWWNSIFWMADTHNTQHTSVVEWNIFLWIGLSDFNVCVISSFMYILHIWSMFWLFIAEIHEILMCIMCVHLTFEGKKHGLISSFLFFLVIYWRGVSIIHDLTLSSCICLSVIMCCVYVFLVPHMFWWVLLSVSENMIPFVNLWQKGE